MSMIQKKKTRKSRANCSSTLRYLFDLNFFNFILGTYENPTLSTLRLTYNLFCVCFLFCDSNRLMLVLLIIFY